MIHRPGARNKRHRRSSPSTHQRSCSLGDVSLLAPVLLSSSSENIDLAQVECYRGEKLCILQLFANLPYSRANNLCDWLGIS